MRIYDDGKIISKHETKEDAMESVIRDLYERYNKGEIKDILIIARTTDEEIGEHGLPHNITNWTSVDTEYEATVFNRFASDMLFDRMKHIAIEEFMESVAEEHKKKEGDEHDNT